LVNRASSEAPLRRRGRQAGKLEREGALGIEHRAGHRRYAEGQAPGLLRESGDEGHERRGREGVSKVLGEKPEGAEAQEGIGSAARLNTGPVATDRCSDQGPEGGAVGPGAAEATRW
jgi:hypothetical protein